MSRYHWGLWSLVFILMGVAWGAIAQAQPPDQMRYHVQSRKTGQSIEPALSSSRVSSSYCGQNLSAAIYVASTVQDYSLTPHEIEGQDNSYVYIFQSDSKNIDRLFPLQNFQSAKEQTNPVHSGRQYFLPDEHQVFVLNHNTGQEMIYSLCFPEPDITLENLYKDYLQARQQQYTAQMVERQNELLKKLQQGSPAGIAVLTFSHLN